MIFAGKSKYIIFVNIVADIFSIFISFFLANFICFHEIFPEMILYHWLLLLLITLWINVAVYFNLFDVPRIVDIDKIIQNNLKAIFLFMVLSITLIFFIFSNSISRIFIALTIFIFAILMLTGKIFLVSFVKKYRTRGYNYKTIVLIGFNENIEKIVDKIMNNPGFGVKISGLFTDAKLVTHSSIFYKGNLNDVITYCDNNHINELMISLPSYKSSFINKLLHYAENNMIRVTIIPEFSEYLSQMFTMDYFDGMPILKIREEPLENLANKMMKRIFDIIFSWFVVLFVFTWLFPVIAILIKLTSRGPVFFTQMRSGKNDQPFKCYKFRSMYVNGDSDTIQASKNDSRVTSIGKFLRKTSLDELPQFFNVIKRNMSIVGPRPHMVKQTDDYKIIINKFMVRHYAKPGITGWAQINGFRGETKEVADMENRAKADIWYIENWNFILDLKIIFLTVWRAFFKRDEKAF